MFKGVCIDGPMNGQLVCTSSPTYTVVVRPKFDWLIPAVNIPPKQFVYRHYNLIGNINLFVPEDWNWREVDDNVAEHVMKALQAYKCDNNTNNTK